MASLSGCTVRGESTLQRKEAIPFRARETVPQGNHAAHGLKACERWGAAREWSLLFDSKR